MKLTRSARRSSKKRAFGALALSSTAMIASAAIAGGASASVLLLTALGTNTMGSAAVTWLQPVVTALTLSTVSASTPANKDANAAATAPSLTPTPAASASQTATKMKLGINVNDGSYSTTARPFANLALLSSVTLRTYKSSDPMPADRLDESGTVVKLNSGETVNRILNLPTKAFRGASVDIICRWTGKGEGSAWGSVVKNQKVSNKSLTFTLVPKGLMRGNLQFSKIDPSDPVKNVDCREVDADRNALFDPTYLANVARFNTVRFMKWETAVESNRPVTWATRTKPGNLDQKGQDGIPIEYLVALANQAKTNPWFCIPWNADDEYIRKFAEYVRDNLDPSLTAYVETSNEVWNYVYKVTVQARDEGVAKNFSSNTHYAALKRYAERTGEVMDIWSSVFAGKMSRIVRVAATQNGTTSANMVLGFRDTAKKVDALATAPYFGWTIKPGEVSPDGIATFFNDKLNPKIDSTLGNAVLLKAVAKQYGLRYITYEAGQHVTSDKDPDLLATISRDPQMGKAYTRYLSKWQKDVGDLMVLFNDYGGIDKYGAWGLQEYVGQPLSETPKAQAVQLFQKSYVVK